MTYTFKVQNQIYRVELDEAQDHLQLEIEGEKIPVEFQKIDHHFYSLIVDGNQSLSVGIFKQGRKIQAFFDGNLYELEWISERERKSDALVSGIQEIESPMPSRIVSLLKTEGDHVNVDEGVIVVEAMKMESELKTTIEGKVKEIKVREGDAVEAGTVLVVIASE